MNTVRTPASSGLQRTVLRATADAEDVRYFRDPRTWHDTAPRAQVPQRERMIGCRHPRHRRQGRVSRTGSWDRFDVRSERHFGTLDGPLPDGSRWYVIGDQATAARFCWSAARREHCGSLEEPDGVTIQRSNVDQTLACGLSPHGQSRVFSATLLADTMNRENAEPVVDGEPRRPPFP